MQDTERTITAEHLSDDEPFEVQAARHQAYIHAVAQVAATAAAAAPRTWRQCARRWRC